MKQSLYQSIRLCLVALLWLLIVPGVAQSERLPTDTEKVAQVANRRITLSVTNRELKAVLDDLSKQANVRFSYSSAVVPIGQRVSLSVTDRPLEQVLTNLLAPLQIQFEITRKQVILSRKNSFLEPLSPKAVTPTAAPMDRTISGQVTDEAGLGLPGATVLVKQRSTIGTSADADGRFTLNIPDGDQTLVVSSIGYLTQEVAVGNRTIVNVTMKESDRSLNEVVVVGYGTQTRRNVTAAISQVKGAELREINAPGLDQALQGRAAGVQVTKNTGAPGGGVSIRVRGTASILGGQEPLYIVDGIPINNTPTGSTDVFSVNRNGGVAGNESINPISQIPIDDIENIEILKDAASASIYGARAANGVVIITTKRGKAGKVEVALSGYTGFGEVPQNRRYKLLNGPEFAQAVNLSRRLRKLPIVYTDSLNVPSTDWQDEIFQRAPINSLNANVSGGTEKVRFSFSAGYFNQQGTIIGTKFNRINLRNSFDFTLSKKVRAGVNLMLSRSNNNRLRNTGSGTGTDSFNNNNLFGPSVLAAALVANPAFRPYTADGRYQIDTLNNNISPVASAMEIKLQTTDDRFIGNIFLEYEILKGLRFRTNWGADARNSAEAYFTPLLAGVYGGAATGATLENGTYRENLWLTENYLTYDFSKGGHAITLLGGFSAQESKNNGFNIRVRNIPSNELQVITAGPQLLAIKEQGYQYWGMVSQFGRLNYSFNNRYLLTATVRRDGSSRFGPDKRYGVFPSFSAGWIVSDESFLKSNNVVSFLKLRLSHGLTGNDQTGDVWSWRASVRPLDNITTSYLGGNGSRPVSIQVGDFSWESTRQTDLGMELALFSNRLSINADYYKRVTRDLLYPIALPNTTGFATAVNNLGSLENRGLELAIGTKNIVKGPFRWSTDFNISFNRNKLLSLYEGRTQDSQGDFGKSTLLRVGEPISFQGLIIDGINPKTGDFLPRDLDGNGVINDLDMTIIGTPLPKHFGGISNRLTYGNFDLNVFFTWSYGNSIQNTTRSFLEQVRIPTNAAVIANMSRDAFFGRWTTPDQPAAYRGFDVSNTYAAVGARPTNFYLEDGSYLRLKSVSLSYNLPKSVVQRLKMSNARFYVNANNLLTFTKYKGYDPEVNHNNTGTNIQIGYDNGTYPNARNYAAGFNLTF